MSLGLTLTTALSSLKVNQESLSLISQNIANANSVDYTRRQITQSAQVVGNQPAGAQIDGITRAVDDYLNTSARRQLSDYTKTKTMDDAYSNLQMLMGQPGADNSINSYVDNFFDSLKDLSTSADQVGLRTNAVQSGTQLASKVSELASNLEQSRSDIDKQVKQTTVDLNNLLKQMYTINQGIKEAKIAKGDSNALLDQRDATLNKISEIMDVGVTINADNTATVFLPRGELVTPEEYFQVDYSPLPSAQSFVDGQPLAPMKIYALDSNGKIDLKRPSQTLVSGTNEKTQEMNLSSGKLKGLLDMRDTEIPNILGQLDQLASTIEDSFNAIHNDGVGFPPASDLTGTNMVSPTDVYDVSGNFMIAALNADGTPAVDPYSSDGSTKMNPLQLNLNTLVGDNAGAGKVTVQSLMKEINSYYGPAVPKAVEGPMDNVKLASVSSTVNITAATGTFNVGTNPAVGATISLGGQTYTFVNTISGPNQIQIQSSTIGTATEIAKALNSSSNANVSKATYSSLGNVVTATARISGSAANGALTLASSSGAIAASGALAGGVDASGQLSLDVEAANLGKFNGTTLSITPGLPGITTDHPGVFDLDAVNTTFTQLQLDAGQRGRSADVNGLNSLVFTMTNGAGADLQEGDTVKINIPVTVTQTDSTQVPPVVSTYQDTVTFNYIVPGQGDDVRNTRYDAVHTVTTQMVQPTVNQGFMRAELVDANGKPVADGQPGYLKISSLRSGLGIGMDEMDSKVVDNTTDSTDDTKGFQLSHYFGLNDFFTSSEGLKNSAINLKVEDRFKNASNLSLGSLEPSKQPADPSAKAIYTYEVGVASAESVTKMANLRTVSTGFATAGGLPPITTTLSSYASEIISYSANRANDVSTDMTQQQTVRTAYTDRISSVGGVNIDEELANTVLFQNNYSASARMISVVNELMKNLIDAF